MQEITGRIFLLLSFSNFSAKTWLEFSVQLIQNCSPDSGLSNGAIKSIKVRYKRCSISPQSYPCRNYGKNGFSELQENAAEINIFVYHSTGNDERSPNMCTALKSVRN